MAITNAFRAGSSIIHSSLALPGRVMLMAETSTHSGAACSVREAAPPPAVPTRRPEQTELGAPAQPRQL
jgi:hypothetical protein